MDPGERSAEPADFIRDQGTTEQSILVIMTIDADRHLRDLIDES